MRAASLLLFLLLRLLVLRLLLPAALMGWLFEASLTEITHQRGVSHPPREPGSHLPREPPFGYPFRGGVPTPLGNHPLSRTTLGAETGCAS